MNKPATAVPSWKKVADSAGAKAAAAIVIALAAWAVFESWEPERRDVPIEVVTSIEGVSLGQPLAAAVSSHGPFDKERERPGVVRKYANEDDYVQRNGRMRLGVRDGVVRTIGYVCKEGRDAAALNNVACHDSGDGIRRVFGDGVRVLCAKVNPDDPNKALAPHVRAYDAVAHGTRYVVIRDVVKGFIVTDAKELDSLVGYNWVKCG